MPVHVCGYQSLLGLIYPFTLYHKSIIFLLLFTGTQHSTRSLISNLLQSKSKHYPEFLVSQFEWMENILESTKPTKDNTGKRSLPAILMWFDSEMSLLGPCCTYLFLSQWRYLGILRHLQEVWPSWRKQAIWVSH